MNSESRKNFWTTLPGILTGVASLITALTGLWIALKNDSSATQNPESNITFPEISREAASDVGFDRNVSLVECEPANRVHDPQYVKETFDLLLSGRLDTDSDVKDLAILSLREQLCGPMVMRGFTADAVNAMSPNELFRAANQYGLIE